MEFIKGEHEKRTLDICEIKTLIERNIGKIKEYETVNVAGIIHMIKRMSGFAFVKLRTRRDIIQCIYDEQTAKFDLRDINEGDSVIIIGQARPEIRSSQGFEIDIKDAVVLSKPAGQFPIVINKKELVTSLDTNLNFRPLSLRNPKERAIFKIQEGIARGFREFLISKDFTEIRTPKIVFAGAEGGSNVFCLDYFGKQVYLAQSPQFYKQAMVGVYDRVFEIAPVFRAEKHNTSRHLNEYISMDFEMGFIKDHTDIMIMETGALKYIMELLKENYQEELKLLNVKLPKVDSVPVIKFAEAKEDISSKYNRPITDYDDFEPDEEKLLCKIIKKATDSDFVFVTHYPSRKRPFYAMDDVHNPEYTLSFDLLYNGLEVTTGGQRIHDYNQQIDKMKKRGMNPKDFESYLMAHKNGLPPHGGLGAGLERLTMKLLGLANIRNASLFPRDIDRVIP